MAMADIRARGRVPLLTGGTFLYFRALEYGLSDLPAADPAVRERLEDVLRREGLPAMYQRLQSVDPAAAARIHATDPQRILRALEVYELTGQPLSALHATGRGEPLPWRFLKLGLVPADDDDSEAAPPFSWTLTYELLLSRSLLSRSLQLPHYLYAPARAAGGMHGTGHGPQIPVSKIGGCGGRRCH